MGSAWRRRRMIAPAIIIVALSLPASAGADTPFTARFSADAEGGITLAANTLETCPDAATGCAAAREGHGTLLDDNDFPMRLVDVDGDGATDDSSSADLRLPAGARVLFAGLYDGARTEAGSRGTAVAHPTPDTLERVWLRGPGQDDYAHLDAAGATLSVSDEVRGAYQTFHDVTGLVRRDGAGEYTVADVPAATGVDRYGGWALVVAYAAPGDPPRNLSVFDGLQSVARGRSSVTIPVSGFRTPLTGPVRTQVGFVAYEGDLGAGGDAVTLDGRTLSDAASPPANFFDSGISVDGAPVTDKTPDYRNQLGFDAKLTPADGILANGATAADVNLRTTLEQYLPGAVTFATDLYSPDVVAGKTVDDLTHAGGAARPGDRLRYTIVYRNRGSEPATELVAEDALPAGETLVPGSLRIDESGERLAPTDVAGDDLGEYDAATRTVRFRLGEGATPATGGTLAAGGAATVSVEAEVDPTSSAGEIVNTARATFVAPALGRPLAAVSSPARIEVHPSDRPPPIADLQVADHEADAAGPTGDEVLDTATVTDRGPDDATGVHVRLVAAPGDEVEQARTDAGSCTVVADGADCALNHLDAGGSVQIELVERAPVSGGEAGAPTEVTATADQLDENAGDNATRAVAPVPAPAPGDAQLATAVGGPHGPATVGGVVTERIVVRDEGPGTASSVVVDGSASAPLGDVRVRAHGLRCRWVERLRCVATRLVPGAPAAISVTGRPERAGALRLTATASSDRIDPRPRLDTGEATTTVRGAHPSLRLGARLSPSAVAPGATVRLALTARDPSAAPVGAASLCVVVPDSVTVVAAGTGRERAGRLCWSLGRLRAGAVRGVSATLAVSATSVGGPLAFVATLRGDGAASARAQAMLDVRRPFTACGVPASPRAGWRLVPDC